MGNKLILFDLRHKRYKSAWYADKVHYKDQVLLNYRIRKFITDESRKSRLDISEIVIQGTNSLKIDLHTSKPGLVLGKSGANINEMKAKIAQLVNIHPDEININLVPINKPELSSALVALRVAQDLERRRSYNHSMRSHAEDAIKFGALGIRIECSGRLNGVEIARNAAVSRGTVPRHTIRANVFYSAATAYTNCGTCGVRVWMNLNLQHGKKRPKLGSTSENHEHQNMKPRNEFSAEETNKGVST